MFCDACGGLLVVLGQLGNRVHLRCRSCGIDCSMNEAAYAEELQLVGRLAEEDAEPDMDDSLPGDFDEPYSLNDPFLDFPDSEKPCITCHGNYKCEHHR